VVAVTPTYGHAV